MLILVSDGKENRNPRMADVKPTLLEKGVVLHVILISDAADKNMIELSASTGGKAFFDSGAPDSTDLQSALRTIVFDDDVSAPGVAPVQVDTAKFYTSDMITRGLILSGSHCAYSITRARVFASVFATPVK